MSKIGNYVSSQSERAKIKKTLSPYTVTRTRAKNQKAPNQQA